MRAAALAVTLTALAVAAWLVAAPPSAHAEPPAPGTAAPDFSLPDQTGTVRTLADFSGRWLVLYFYPRDDTPGCTKQACAFRDDIAALRAAGAQVVGVSVDGVESHAAFARKHGLPFPLLADTEGDVAAAYGSLRKLGPLRMARRHTFVIDPQGRIAARFLDIDPEANVAEVLAVLRTRGAGA
jgi:thioredoxin-dependent peroxiredoxin